MNRSQRIAAALDAAFAPLSLRVVDDSARHAGHAGAQPGGETHYTVEMVSAVFAGQSRLARSRAVNAALQPEFDTGLHALSLRLDAPA